MLKDLLKDIVKDVKTILGIKEQNNLKFPSKKGQNAHTCVGLLDLHGSLFCLDNQNILFYDEEKKLKVIKPSEVLPASKKHNDLDAYLKDDGFAIKYEDKDYFYKAKIKVLYSNKFIRIKLEDIRQPVIDASVKDDQICLAK